MTIEDYHDRVKRAGILYVDAYPFFLNNSGEAEILLLKRRDDVLLPSIWQPVCGKIAKNETICRAFARQVCEKTGQQPAELYKLHEVNIFYDENYDTVMLVPSAAAQLVNKKVKIDAALHTAYRWVKTRDVAQYLPYPKQIECISIIENFLQGDCTPGKIKPLTIEQP